MPKSVQGKSNDDRDLLNRLEKLGASFQKIDPKVLAAFLDQFGLMLHCGLRPGDALEALGANQESPMMVSVIEDLSERIHTGFTVSKAMSFHPNIFPSTVIMLVKVGENGGFLDRQLRRAGEMISRTNGFVAKIKSAITGPLITALFCGLILFAIVKLVFPKFLTMYESMGIEFPAISEFVFVIVNLVNHPITLGVVVFGLLGSIFYRKQLQQATFTFLLYFPGTRPILGKVLCATTCETLATLHHDGVPLHRVLTLMSDNGPFPVHLNKLKEAKKVLISTGSLHESMLGIDYFPNFFHSMVAIGEETGALDQLLDSCQKLLEQEIEVLVDRVANALEPMVTVLMGISMAVLFIGMFLPIYGILNKLGGG